MRKRKSAKRKLTPAEINRRNAIFWQAERQKRDAQIEKYPHDAEVAARRINRLAFVGMLRAPESIESTLAEYAEVRGAAAKSGASRAVKARHEREQKKLDEKREQLRALWLSGRYATKESCAYRNAARLGLKESSARRALAGLPNPRKKV